MFVPSLVTFPSPSCPAPLFSAPRALQRRAHRSPYPRWPSPRPSTSRRRRPSCHARCRLASSCFTRAVLLLVLKLAQKSHSTFFTHSTAQHCFSFLHLLDYPRRSSAAASARRCQPPSPPHTRKPVLLQHRRNPLKLTEQSNSIPRAHTARTTAPVSSSSTATRSRRRPDAPPPLSPCRAHHQHHITPRKLSSHFPAALRHSGHRNTVAAPRSPAARFCSPSTRRLRPSLPQLQPPA
jgi:hypothetical protein